MKQYSDEEDLIPLPKSSSESEFDASDSEVDVSYSDEDQISGSDSEPECISFSTTQENRKQNLKLTAQTIKVQKDELKRKRKEIFLQNLKQREEKRQKLASKRLPDHILENLDDNFETTESKDENPDTEENTEKDRRTEIIQTAGNVTFKCKILPTETQKSRYIPEKVAHFKEQMLYGNRIRREKSTRHAVLKREKQYSKR